MFLMILLLVFGFNIILKGGLALIRICGGFATIIFVIVLAISLLRVFANTFGYIIVLILVIGLFIKLLS